MTLRKKMFTRAWALAALGIAVAVLVLAFVLMGSARAGGVSSVTPTPCPDAIACHALKRMPTSAVQP
jgi:hypothetical protein